MNDETANAELLKLLGQGQNNYQQLLNQNQQLLQQNQQLQTLVNDLRQQLDKLQRMIFGQKSERQKKPLADKDENQDESLVGSSYGKKSATQKSSNGRRPLPKDLPRTVMKHDLLEDQRHCAHCESSAIHCIGKDVSEQLDLIPAKLYVIEHRRYKYACRYCQQVTTAPMPEQPIDKGLAASGLLAETLLNKYQEHLPLYRLEQRYIRIGYPIPRSTLCDWVTQCAQRLEPIVKAMHQDMLQRTPKIHSDDTIIPVLAKGKTHNGRLWVYIGGGGHAPPTVIYRYSKTRRGAEPKNFLGDYQGYLQADAYSGYDQCYASGDIIEVACMAHARRKFVDALTVIEEPALAQQAIEQVAELYAIEKIVKSMTDKQRYYYRKRYAKPKLKQFYKWLCETKGQSPPKSPLGKAISYALNHFKALGNYLRDGVCSIDNNIAERAMKSVVLGRKNYLFAGSHEGAHRAAIIYSLIETCKLLEINTFDYLRDVLERLPTTLHSQIQTLFPYNWKQLSNK